MKRFRAPNIVICVPHAGNNQDIVGEFEKVSPNPVNDRAEPR